MMSSSIKTMLAVFCVVLVVVNGIADANPIDSKQEPLKLQSKQQDQPKPAEANLDDERLPIGSDGSLFLAGNECGPDEQLSPGMLPTCEPTCDNPRPFCPKIFFSGIDYVPCFCKAPLVRNPQTKQCVPLSECPPKTKGPDSNTQQIRW